MTLRREVARPYTIGAIQMNQRDEELHSLARSTAAALSDPDRKQLRFNDIVRVAPAFYYNDRC